MRETDLFDELQFGMLGQRRDGLRDTKHGADDIIGRVAQIPLNFNVSRNTLMMRLIQRTTALSECRLHCQSSPPNMP